MILSFQLEVIPQSLSNQVNLYKNITVNRVAIGDFSLGNIVHINLLSFSIFLKPHTDFLIIFLGI